MKLPTLPWHRALPWIAKAAAVGVLLIVLGAVFQWRPLADLGGAMLTPGLVVAGGACMLVVLMAPVWPAAALAEKVPTWARWPFAAAVVVLTLAWWALWVSIALGDHSGW